MYVFNVAIMKWWRSYLLQFSPVFYEKVKLNLLWNLPIPIHFYHLSSSSDEMGTSLDATCGRG